MQDNTSSVDSSVVDSDLDGGMMRDPRFVAGFGTFEKLGMPNLVQISFGMQGDDRDYIFVYDNRVVMAKLDGEVLGLNSNDQNIRQACSRARKFLDAMAPDAVTWVPQGYLCNCVGDYFGYVTLDLKEGKTDQKFVLGSGTFEKFGLPSLRQVSFASGDERDYLFALGNRLIMAKIGGEVFGLQSNNEEIRNACRCARAFLKSDEVQWVAQGKLCNVVGDYYDYLDPNQSALND